MKIAYLGKIQLSDTDLPYLYEAQQLADITYVMEVNPRFMKGPAYDIKQLHPRSGLFKAVDIYPEFRKLQGFIDLDRFYVLNTSGRLWVLKSFWTNLLLTVFLLRGKFDVVHLAWPPNIYEFMQYVLRRKMFLTVHDPIPHSQLNTPIVRMRRWVAFRLIPRFVLFNKSQLHEFLSYYHVAARRVTVVRMSSCTYLHTVEPDTTTVPSPASYILFAGKISPYKGLDYLLPAMEQVHRQCPDSKLIVAGSGKYHFDIGKYQSLDYIDIRNRFIPDKELVALIQNAAFLVCPYTNATQSGVIMSAFAFCKPVIATNVGGLPEMVQHMRHGLIIKERNTQALAESIVSLWQQPELLKEFSKNISQDYGTGKNSWRHTAEQLNKEYALAAQ